MCQCISNADPTNLLIFVLVPLSESVLRTNIPTLLDVAQILGQILPRLHYPDEVVSHEIELFRESPRPFSICLVCSTKHGVWFKKMKLFLADVHHAS